ncbi:terpene cyclase/mutase family protein [Chloroflexales bacterium ZM16-3]|nr:terpene cyclase/mutase family protein [Chloroflexales bacterium ZM16-3]
MGSRYNLQSTIYNRAERAIAWLRSDQRPSGELPTFTARRPDMSDARPYACCVYTTTFVIHALARLSHIPEAVAVREAAGGFLRTEANGDGSWSYEGRATHRVPPDLDDTACATAALIGLGERPGLGFYQQLWENESAPGGPYFTWLGVNGIVGHLLARQVDALVQANVLLCASMAGLELPGVVSYLLDVVARDDLAMASDYCITSHLLVYAIARAYADGPAPALAPALPALRVAATALPTGSAFELACQAAALISLGAPGDARLGDLLDAQLPNGSWPMAAAYSGYPPHLDGAPALTTAIALDALGRGTLC